MNLKKIPILILNCFIFSVFLLNAQGEFETAEHNLTIYDGTVKRFLCKSDYVDDRFIDIWLPPSFSESKKYPVLYMHDGQTLFDSRRVWNGKEWMMDEKSSELLKDNKIKEFILVGIWNNGNKRHIEYFPEKSLQYIQEPQLSELKKLIPDGPLSDNYLKFIVKELKPFIDKNFPVKSDRKNTYIGGSSMGGLISWYAVCEYPDVFSGAICLSTHWIGTFENNKEIPDGFNEYLKKNLPNPKKHRFYFDYGTEGLDANYPPYQAIIDSTMKQKGYTKKNWITLEFVGDNHNEEYWAKRIDKPLLFLFGK